MNASTRSQDLCEQILRRKSLTDRQARQLIRSHPEQLQQLKKVECAQEKNLQLYPAQGSTSHGANDSAALAHSKQQTEGLIMHQSSVAFKTTSKSSPRNPDTQQSQTQGKSRDAPSLLQRNSGNTSRQAPQESVQESKSVKSGKTGRSAVEDGQCAGNAYCASRSGLLDSIKADGLLSGLACARDSPKRVPDCDPECSDVELPEFFPKPQEKTRETAQNALSSQQEKYEADNLAQDQSSEGDFLGFIDGSTQGANQVCTGSQVYFFGEEQQERGLAQDLAEFFTGSVETAGRYTAGSRYSRKPPSVFDGQIVSNLPRKSRRLPDRRPRQQQ